jgi:hypothetical protein
MSTPSPSTTSRLRALSASLSPSDTNNTSTTAEIEQLRRDAQQHPTHRTSLHDPVALATAVAPPVSFKLDAEMSRAHLANQLCTGSGQLYVHSPAQVPSQYYICAKSLLQFDYSLSADNDVLLMPRLQQLRLRLVLFAEREHRYVYVLAEAYLPLRATHKGTFQFFVPPITVRLSLVYVTSLSR